MTKHMCISNLKSYPKYLFTYLENYSSLKSKNIYITIQCTLSTHAQKFGVSVRASQILHIAPLWTACPHNCSNIVLCDPVINKSMV